MKKTFRRAIACLLTVLMVVCSMPFTAFALHSPQWWNDSDLPLTAEPDYVGYDDLYASGEYEYDLNYGDVIYAHDGDPYLIENYRPAMFVTVSDVTDSITEFYGKNATCTYDSMKSKGKIVDPSNLKAGQVIAVAMEYGGTDSWYSGQCCGQFDTTKLQAVYNQRNAWKPATNVTQAIISKTDTALYSGVLTSMTVYNCDPNGSWANNMLRTADEPESNYVGKRPEGAGHYGIMFAVMSFKVLEDGDLRDMITIDGDACYFNAYKEDLNVTGSADRFGVEETPGYTHRLMPVSYPDIASKESGTKHVVTFVNAAGETVSSVEYPEGTKAADIVVPENTADADKHNTYAWPEIADVTAPVTYTEVKTTAEHVWTSEVKTAATCTGNEVRVYTCTVGGESYEAEVENTAKGHTEVVDPAKAPTCTETGLTEGKHCSVCNAVLAAQETVAATGHTEVVDPAKAPTCTETGLTEGKHCSVCNAVLAAQETVAATGHAWSDWKVTTEPTFDKTGVETRTCATCAKEETRTVPALSGGIPVTVAATDLGTATINGEAVTDADVTVKVALNSKVVLTATPAEGNEFIGWTLNGKMISKNANIEVTALAAATYVPVFQAANAQFTVMFTDGYGNVISTQTVASGADIDIPAVPSIAGYETLGWSMTDDEIKALAESKTISAQYKKLADTYTVKAAGCAITVDGGEAVMDTATAEYNSFVTVTAENAKSWSVNGATVAYGDTYSFYVGSDVTVTPVISDETVTAVPTVAAVSTTAVGTAPRVAASFLATRAMTDDCQYVNAGFVYGKNLDNNNITLADVDGSTVRASYCVTDAEQFALNWGIAEQTGTITARAFLAYIDADGAPQVAYADPQTFDYASLA